MILLVSLLVRLYQIDGPLIGFHATRQMDTATIARNYYERGLNFFRPEVNWLGPEPVVAGTEFPLHPYLAALIATVVGYSDQIGRLISVAAGLAAIYFVYRLAHDLIDRPTAIWAAIVFAASAPVIYYSRSFQPDMPMTAAAVAGVYALHRWTATGRTRWIALSAALVALAGLLKLTALQVLLPAAFWFWIAGRDRLGRRAAGGLYLVAVLVPVAAWYAYSRQLDRESGIVFFGNSDFVGGRWVSGPLLVSLDYWRTIFGNYLVGRYLAYLGLPIFLIGLVLPRRRPAEWAIDLWLVAYLLTSLVIVRGTYIHEYYQLPLAVPVAIVIGRAAARFVRPAEWRRWVPAFVTICLTGFFVLSAARYVYTYLASERIETNRLYQFAQEVRARTAPDDRIVSVDGMFFLYHADRRGWYSDRDQVTAADLRDKIDRGAGYLVGQAADPPAGPAQDVIDRYLAEYPIVYQDDRSFIVRLAPPGR